MDHQEWLEQHDQMIADAEIRRERDMAALLASQEKTERALRRAIRLSVLDARRQRAVNAAQAERNTGFEASIERLNNALAAFLERGGNGKH